jgi:erythromycin esterase-like protein
VGVDCQFNTFHPDMVKEYLEAANAPFLAEAASLLEEAKTAANDGFKTYNTEAFEAYLQKMDALQDSVTAYGTELIAASSEKEYALHTRILKVIRQVSEVRYYGGKQDYTINYRDQYMAENTAWWQDYFQGEKMVVWAHNWHIADNVAYVAEYANSGSMGYHLAKQYAADYTNIGFSFSQGAFNAVGREGEQNTGLKAQMIADVPPENSLNAFFSHATPPVFFVSVADLEKHDEWQKAFNDGIKLLSIGAVFNNKPVDYYYAIRKTDFDHLIYIDRTTASTLLY